MNPRTLNSGGTITNKFVDVNEAFRRMRSGSEDWQTMIGKKMGNRDRSVSCDIFLHFMFLPILPLRSDLSIVVD